MIKEDGRLLCNNLPFLLLKFYSFLSDITLDLPFLATTFNIWVPEGSEETSKE